MIKSNFLYLYKLCFLENILTEKLNSKTTLCQLQIKFTYNKSISTFPLSNTCILMQKYCVQIGIDNYLRYARKLALCNVTMCLSWYGEVVFDTNHSEYKNLNKIVI